MHEAIYRCINEACGRPTPRPVKFCPWCGTAQARVGAGAPAPAPARERVAAAAQPRASDAPPPAAPSATEFGLSGKPPAAAPDAPHAPHAPAAPPRQEVPRPPLEARPPGRAPIRLRWWLLALALLWGVWLLAKPSARKIDRRIDEAITLARECKGSEAQAELIALRKSRATPEQLQRLQEGLNDEAAKCTRRRQRGKAWNEASGAVESALAAASWDKARARLQAFTKRWGEDEDSDALKARIEDLRRADAAHREHPLAAPPGGAVGTSGGGATKAQAEREGQFQ